MSISDELQRLHRMHDSGQLSDKEFNEAKDALFSGSGDPGAGETAPPSFGGGADLMDPQTRQWGLFLHLSLLAGLIVPLAGLIVPIVIWQIKKNELPGVDVHGKNAVNWIISDLIYTAVSFVLCFVVIGFLGLLVLGVLSIVFPVIAAIKANNGEAWKYPLSIRFL